MITVLFSMRSNTQSILKRKLHSVAHQEENWNQSYCRQKNIVAVLINCRCHSTCMLVESFLSWWEVTRKNVTNIFDTNVYFFHAYFVHINYFCLLFNMWSKGTALGKQYGFIKLLVLETPSEHILSDCKTFHIITVQIIIKIQ